MPLYILICSSQLRESVQPLLDWRERNGYEVEVWSLTEPSQIREKLKEKKESGLYSSIYLFIVGDYHQIPTWEVNPFADSYYPVCSDFYYQDLESVPDADGDGRLGEYQQDGVHFPLDVFCGRLPFSDPDLVNEYCRRVVYFEQKKSRQKILLLGATLFFPNEDFEGYPFIDGGEYLDYLYQTIFSAHGLAALRYYEAEGLLPSKGQDFNPLSRGQVSDAFKEENFCLVNWSAHGSEYAVWRKVWRVDDGNRVPEFTEMEETSFMGKYTWLNPLNPFFGFANSCINAYPEVDNFVKYLLEQAAVGVVATVDLAYDVSYWDDPNDGGSSSLNYWFMKKFVDEGMKAGEALAWTKQYYFENLFDKCDYYLGETPQVNQLNLMAYALFGDPALVFWPVSLPDQEPPFIARPSFPEGATYSCPRPSFKFYIDDPSGVDWSSLSVFIDENPADYSAGTPVEVSPAQNLGDGLHTLKVRVKDKAGNLLQWERNFYIKIPKRLVVFPNPCKDYVKVSIPRPCGKAKLAIYDLTGRRLFSEEYDFSRPVEVDMSGFPSGLYLLHIKTENAKYSAKVVRVK